MSSSRPISSWMGKCQTGLVEEAQSEDLCGTAPIHTVRATVEGAGDTAACLYGENRSSPALLSFLRMGPTSCTPPTPTCRPREGASWKQRFVLKFPFCFPSPQPCAFQTSDKTILYSVATTLVNCTNSYDVKEVIPELVQLAKFSKQHVPEEHPKVGSGATWEGSGLCHQASKGGGMAKGVVSGVAGCVFGWLGVRYTYIEYVNGKLSHQMVLMLFLCFYFLF